MSLNFFFKMYFLAVSQSPIQGVFNLLSSRVNLHLSYNPVGRSRCRLQNHPGYIKHHHRGMGGLPGDIHEVPMTKVKQRKGCRTSCDVGKAAEGLHKDIFHENKLLCNKIYKISKSVQPLHRFSYVTAHFPNLPPLYLRHSSFSNPSVVSPTSQFILQPFFRFTYVTGSSPMSQLILQPFRRFTYFTGNSTTLLLLHLRHRHFT